MKTEYDKYDEEYIQDITAVIVALEGRGMTEQEVIEYIEKVRPDLSINAKLYFAYRNAGKGNPLRMKLEQIKFSLLDRLT